MTDTSSTRSRFIIAVVTIIAFLALDWDPWWIFRGLTDKPEGTAYLFALTVYRWLPYLIGPVIVAGCLFGLRAAADALGLNRPIGVALLVAAAITVILPLTYIAMTPFRIPEDLVRKVLQYAILPGIGEEILYRAFLFGLLFRFCGTGFLPAALLGAIIFGAGHVAQGGNAMEAAEIFLLTASGGLWFAWLYVEWNYNIWVPAAFHTLMNFWWLFFDISDTAAGPAYANAARFAVILISIIATIIAARRRGGRIVTGKLWIWGLPSGPRSTPTS